MSEWLDDYIRRLDQIATVQPGKPPVDRVAQLRASARNHAPKGTMGGGGFDWKNANSASMGLVLAPRIIDLLSRGQYASANVIKNAQKQNKAPGFLRGHEALLENLTGQEFFDTVSPMEDLKAGWRGLSGKDKSSYGEVLRDSGMEEGWKRTALGFGMDVAFDPISYIPGAAFVKGGRFLKAGASKIPGSEKVLKAHAPGKTHSLEPRFKDPKTAAADDLAETGVTKVTTDGTDDFMETLRKEQQSIVGEFGPLPVGDAVDLPTPAGLPGKALHEGVPEGTQGDLFPDLQGLETNAMLGALDSGLKNVITRRQPRSPLFEEVDEITGVKNVYRDEVTKKVTNNFSPNAFVTEKLFSRYIIDNPQKNFIQPSLKYGGKKAENGRTSRYLATEWVREAKTPKIRAARAQIVDDMVKDTARKVAGDPKEARRFLTNASVKTISGKGVGKKPVKEIANDILSNKPVVPRSSGDYRLPYSVKGGRNSTINISDYRKQVAAQIEKLREDPAQIVEDIVTEKVWDHDEFTWAKVSKAKSGEARAAWRAEMELAGFTKTEIAGLLRRANLKGGKASYDKYLKKITERPVVMNHTLDSLEEAIKMGMVSMDDPYLQNLFKTFGVKTIRGIRGRLKKMEERGTKVAKTKEDFVFDKASGQGAFFPEAAAKSKQSKKGTSPAVEELGKDNVDLADPWHRANVSSDIAPTADEMVEDALETGSEVIEKRLATLTPEMGSAVTKVLDYALNSQYIAPLRNKGMWDKAVKPTATGSRRTSATPGEGFARYVEGHNKFAQYSISRELLQGLSDDVPDWYVRPIAERTTMYMNSMKAIEDTLRAQNINPILGSGKSSQYPLSIHDIFDSLGDEWVAMNYMTKTTAMPITHTMDMAEMMLDQAGKAFDADTIRAALLDQAKAPIRSGRAKGRKAIPNNYYKHVQKTIKGKKAQDKYIVENIVDPMIAAFPKIDHLVKVNRANLTLKEGQATRHVTKETVKEFEKALRNGEIAKSIRMLTKPEKVITDAAKAAEVSNIKGLGQAVKESFEVTAAQVASTPTMAVAAKGAEAMGRATTNGERALANMDISKGFMDEADAIADDLIRKGELKGYDIGQQIEWHVGANMLRRVGPHIGNGAIRPFMLGEYVASQSISQRFSGALAKVSRAHSQEDIISAFNHVRTGNVEGFGPEMAGVVDELNKLTKEIYDPSNPQYDLLGRNGLTIEHMNKMFDHFGMDPKYRFQKSFDEWTTWDIEDPLVFLSRSHAAAKSQIAMNETGSTLALYFGSKTAKPGMVKITNNSGKDSLLFDSLPPGYYYPKEIAEQFSVMDEMLTNLYKSNIRGGKSDFLRKYDSLLHAIKSGYTIYRPGHHIRNALGDLWLNMMRGVVNPKYYKDALRVQAVMKGRYSDFDARQALQGMGELAGGTGKTVVKTKSGHSLTDAQAYSLMSRKGGLPDHNLIEDLGFEGSAFDAAGQISNRMPKPAGGRIHKGATVVSEVRDHHFRIAQFLHEMEHLKPRTHFPSGRKMTPDEVLDDLATRASQQVRKHHPDGSDLTQFEKDVMRRSITFYSWARKMVPLVVEHVLMQPGRFMMYPKAMYNIAQGHGVDLHSMEDPFPMDQLFPSFLRESVQGPVMGRPGEYVGVKAGIPGVDILDDYFYGPDQTFNTMLGSVTPIARVPAELAFGTKAEDQIPIMDFSDYIGQQIPNMRYADQAANSLTGRTVSSGFMDPMRESTANEDYEGPIEGRAFLNWITGLGFTDYSKPSYIKTAEREQGERLRNR